MHELSIVYELYRTVTQLAAEAGLHRVEAVRLQVGELSGVESRTPRVSDSGESDM